MDTPWQDRAACRDTDPDVFFGPCRHHGQTGATCRVCGEATATPVPPWTPIAARAICATCPVQRQCLDAAVDRHEQNGIWAGAGGDLLRLFRRARRASPDHRDSPHCHCRYCRAVAAHLAQLAAEFAEQQRRRPPVTPRNGPAVTHGRASTDARGCRCARCTFRASVAGTALHRAGVDLPAWWDHTLGHGHGCIEGDSVTGDIRAAREAITVQLANAITTRLASLDRDVAWFARRLGGVLDPDTARIVATGADTSHACTLDELRAIGKLLRMQPAALLDTTKAAA
jgi:WhiB family redox-sensing transcriptional regulator